MYAVGVGSGPVLRHPSGSRHGSRRVGRHMKTRRFRGSAFRWVVPRDTRIFDCYPARRARCGRMLPESGGAGTGNVLHLGSGSTSTRELQSARWSAQSNGTIDSEAYWLRVIAGAAFRSSSPLCRAASAGRRVAMRSGAVTPENPHALAVVGNGLAIRRVGGRGRIGVKLEMIPRSSFVIINWCKRLVYRIRQ